MATKYPEMARKRKQLPIASYASQVIDALRAYNFCVVCGETGCGKSTQIPQFLLEHEISNRKGGSCAIYCTQPRRISALGLAERVASERGEKVGDIVGYNVRLDSKVSRNTRVTFCTTGILLRKLIGDARLSDVTHVIVDEVHERSLDSDMLLLLLKDLMRRRSDLKILLMSATANAELFAQYFNLSPYSHGNGSGGNGGGSGPIISVPGKMFPVTQFFLEDAYHQLGWQMQQSDKAGGKKGKGGGEEEIDYKLIENVVAMILDETPSTGKHSAILVFLPGMREINRARDQLRYSSQLQMYDKGLFLVPLHSTLTPAEQAKVYQHAPKGMVKVILSTNIAETSITVDDVVYIIDTGKHKELLYDSDKGIAMLKETWISKASAKQRRGRAGRVAPGTCWHLFSGNRHEKMATFQSPEILRVPLEMLCLKVKACISTGLKESLGKMITPPDVKAIDGAIHKLFQLQAIDEEEELTPLGRILSEMPLDACAGKMLVYGVMLRCIDPVLTIAAAMSSKSPFISPMEERQEANAAHAVFAARSYKSDHLMIVTAFNAWQVVMQEEGHKKARQFCMENYLSFNSLQGIEALRVDYARVLLEFGFIEKSYFADLARGRGSRGLSRKLHGDSHKDLEVDTEAYNSRVIKSVVCAAYYPSILRVAHPKAKYKECEFGTIRKEHVAKGVKVFAKELGRVFLHPASSLFSVANFETGWLAYSAIMKTSKIMVRECTMVPSFAVLLFGGRITSDHDKGILFVDGWAQFKAPATVAILVRELRTLVNMLLSMKVENPRLDISQSDVVEALLKIMTTDGM